ncbi:MAG: lipase family protein [Caldilineaceae bacterium]|nr:lipase family protein [Caldilineaceae bacterium]
MNSSQRGKLGAQAMAHLANYTYHLNSMGHDLEALQKQLQPMGLVLNITPGNPFYDIPSGHHGYIVSNGESVVIAIRGSGEADDWRNNLRCRQVPYRLGGAVHAGFSLAAYGLTQAIMAELRRAFPRYQGKPLWLTGHSSGGTVAILVAQELAAQKIAVAGIYTFGAPKIGDAEYAQRYPLRKKVHAFATLGDLVPLLPPAWPTWHGGHLEFQRYYHVCKPQLLIGKTFSLRAALAHFHNRRATVLEKCVGALIDFGPHSLAAAYVPNLR